MLTPQIEELLKRIDIYLLMQWKQMIINSKGKISYANIGKEAEVKQLENLPEDLQDK